MAKAAAAGIKQPRPQVPPPTEISAARFPLHPDLIVGLDATTQGRSPLVGESKVSRSENNYFAFIRVLHTNN
jgi:hypothetical protein